MPHLLEDRKFWKRTNSGKDTEQNEGDYGNGQDCFRVIWSENGGISGREKTLFAARINGYLDKQVGVKTESFWNENFFYCIGFWKVSGGDEVKWIQTEIEEEFPFG